MGSGLSAFEEFKIRAENRVGRQAKKQGQWYRLPHVCHPEGDEEKLSLAFRETPDGVVIVSGKKPSYTTQDIVHALGLEMKDLFPERDEAGVFAGQPVVKRYHYHDQLGNPVGMVGRTQDKQFPQGTYVQGRLKPGLNGQTLPIYRLPQIKQAIYEKQTIYVTEGEKDADALWNAGYPATTKPGGANSKWQPEQVHALEGATVVIVADKDSAGEECARVTFNALRGGCTIKGIYEAKTGKDAFDHLAAGHTVEEFQRRKDLEPARGLEITTFNGTFKDVEVEYLIEPYFPKGKMILVDADSGMGKTTWLLSVAAGLSNGYSPFGEVTAPTKTLYLYKDADEAAEYETVYRANGGKEGFISYYRCTTALTSELAALIIETIQDHGFGFIVFDPFTYFLDGAANLNASNDVLPALTLAGDICRRTNVCAASVRHTGKSTKDKDAQNLGVGSFQFRASARGQLVMQWHPDREMYKGVVVVSDEKGAILTAKGEPFAFRKIGLRIEYVHLKEDPFTKLPLTRSLEAEQWLIVHVPSDKKVRSKLIEEMAVLAGFNISGTFNRAKAKVCEASKSDGVWYLQLKTEYVPEPEYDPWLDS